METEQQGTGRTRRHWNEQQQVTEFTNELNETWTFEWDTNRQLTRATAPDSGVWQYAYDTRGNLILATDPEAQTTSYDWDSDFAFPTIQVRENSDFRTE
ncbi:YD repeat-containing protein [Providencia alcalifaciens]|nr:YD repeat-containing protein [Providencia alcalifaciens]